MTPEQCRMGRAGVGLGVRELGNLSEVSFTTINRFEKTGNANVSTVNKIREALEAAGIIFLPDGVNVDGGPGVRLRDKG